MPERLLQFSSRHFNARRTTEELEQNELTIASGLTNPHSRQASKRPVDQCDALSGFETTCRLHDGFFNLPHSLDHAITYLHRLFALMIHDDRRQTSRTTEGPPTIRINLDEQITREQRHIDCYLSTPTNPLAARHRAVGSIPLPFEMHQRGALSIRLRYGDSPVCHA